MEGFVNTHLQLVLTIKEGANFDRIQKPTILIGTVSGESLETPLTEPNCNPTFCTDLTWDVDKTMLRKMRLHQTPVKIECFAVSEYGYREKIGYILLSIRNSQIIYKGKESQLKINWHSILGIKSDLQSCKPKLLLALYIREKEEKQLDTLCENTNMIGISNKIGQDLQFDSIDNNTLIKLDSEAGCHDFFLLNIIVQSASNLNIFSQYQNNAEAENFNISYQVLDRQGNLESFTIEDSNTVFLNERIILKIQSSLETLRQYFQSKPLFVIILRKNGTVIGQTNVDLKPLITTDDIQDFLRTNRNSTSSGNYTCIFRSAAVSQDFSDCNKLPHVKLHIALQYIGFRNNVGKDINTVVSTDYQRENKSSNNLSFPESIFESHSNNQAALMSDAANTFSHEDFQNVANKKDIPYNFYSITINLNYIQIKDLEKNIDRIQFQFKHSKGDIVNLEFSKFNITAQQKIPLENIQCKLNFITNTLKIDQLLESLKPTVLVYGIINHSKLYLGQASIDLHQIHLEKIKNHYFTIKVLKSDSGHEVGHIEGALILENDHLLQSNGHCDKQEEMNNNFDENVTYDCINQLEIWKMKQKEIFKLELKKKEEARITLLNDEWQRRREVMESNIAQHVDQCKLLADSLTETTENLRIRKQQCLERETKLLKENEELRWKYEKKIHQLQDALHKMQMDFTSKILLAEEENKKFRCQIELLYEKNNELERVVIEQRKEILGFKKGDSAQIVIRESLKKKDQELSNIQASKKFYKEKWCEAKIQKAHQQQVTTNQGALYNINTSDGNLEKILQIDTAALTLDHLALNKIQQELQANTDMDCIIQGQFPEKLLHSNFSDEKYANNAADVTFTVDSGNRNSSLKKLIEERESLLRTGSYTLNDDIIIKLDAEIKRLSTSGSY